MMMMMMMMMIIIIVIVIAIAIIIVIIIAIIGILIYLNPHIELLQWQGSRYLLIRASYDTQFHCNLSSSPFT